jgi:hypothetical protein
MFEIDAMSNRLALSAALSILLMAGLVLFQTRPADVPFGAGPADATIEASAYHPGQASAGSLLGRLFGALR